MNDLELLLLVALGVVAIDFAAWTEAWLVAGYLADHERMKGTYRLGWSFRSMWIRYVPLLCSAVLFTFAMETENRDEILLWASGIFLCIYAGVAGWLFHRILKAYLSHS